jgi:hypothetical protein
MRKMMRLATAPVLAALAAGPRAWATDAGGGSTQARCSNLSHPVTGHVLCIDPLGAPVEAPPLSYEAPCKADAHTSADWSYGPKCKSQTTGADRVQQSAPSM